MANTFNPKASSSSVSAPTLLCLLPSITIGSMTLCWLASRRVLNTLGAVFPLPVFENDMLRTLGIAPSQLHPSSWASLRAFQFLCHFLFLLPSDSLFLYYHTIHVSKKVSWIRLVPHPDRPLLTEYIIPTSHFCHDFVKLKVIENVSFISDKRPFIPYWRLPVPFTNLCKGDLTLMKG
ncbi:hypothetical protein CR513_43120, partial [Mucuna pruriens]